MVGATEGKIYQHILIWTWTTLTRRVTLTSHKQFKVLHICWIHSIPIGGYTSVGTRVSIHGVVQGQVATDKVDISSTS